MIYPYDVKVLKALKAAQYSEQFYVYVDAESGECYHLKSKSYEEINSVSNNPSVSKIKNKKGFLSSSLSNLVEEKCLNKPLTGNIYQVTYIGWLLPSVRRAERRKLILTHVAFPSLVALITTILTLLVSSWLNNAIKINSQPDSSPSQATEYSDQQLDD